MSEENLLGAAEEDGQQKIESGSPVYLTGTCANCKSRLRFDAHDVCNLERVHCPHCGFDLGDDGRVKIIDYARRLLGKGGK